MVAADIIVPQGLPSQALEETQTAVMQIKEVLAAGNVPSGTVLMWFGTLASIPAGYVLCDGSNGTPDLRSKFVYGVQSGEDPGTVVVF